eukprot:c43396_g1_i1 orf=109-294(+)
MVYLSLLLLLISDRPLTFQVINIIHCLGYLAQPSSYHSNPPLSSQFPYSSCFSSSLFLERR